MQAKGASYAIISSATFGLIPLFSVTAMNGGQTPYSVLFYRFLISVILFRLVLFFRKTSLKISLKQFLEVSILGGICYGGTALFLILSYGYIPTGISTTIGFLYPVMVALIMLAVFKQQPSIGIITAIVLSLAGVALMTWSHEASFNMRGIMFATITVITYSIYIVGLNKSSLTRLPGSVVTFYVLAVSTVVFFLAAMLSGGIPAIQSIKVGANLVCLAIFATIISNLTLVLAVNAVGSTAASILGSAEPLTALMVGIFWFGEQLSAIQIIGVILVICSVLLVVVRTDQIVSLLKKWRN
ncbi:MAG: DMT family transporter [Bacteroidales bacterium]